MRIYFTVKRYRFEPPVSSGELAQQMKQGNFEIIQRERRKILVKFQKKTFLITLDPTGKFVDLYVGTPLIYVLLLVIVPFFLLGIKVAVERHLSKIMNEIVSWTLFLLIVVGIIYGTTIRSRKAERSFIAEFEKYVPAK